MSDLLPLRRRLLEGESLAGPFVQTGHPAVPELLGSLGVDFVCIDQEHSAMGPETVQTLVAGAALAATPALVRVADATPHHLAAALDAGAAGVLVPRVSSADAARDVVRWSRYPPLGERGLGPGRASAYGRAIPELLTRANEEVLVSVQVETRAAVDALDEILAVEGVDLVFVGPGDLSASLGLEGGLGDPRLPDIVAGILARARGAGRATGVFAPDAVTGARWRAEGVQLLVLASDLSLLAGAVERAWAELRG